MVIPLSCKRLRCIDVAVLFFPPFCHLNIDDIHGCTRIMKTAIMDIIQPDAPRIPTNAELAAELIAVKTQLAELTRYLTAMFTCIVMSDDTRKPRASIMNLATTHGAPVCK